jgi:DnaJ domain
MLLNARKTFESAAPDTKGKMGLLTRHRAGMASMARRLVLNDKLLGGQRLGQNHLNLFSHLPVHAVRPLTYFLLFQDCFLNPTAAIIEGMMRQSAAYDLFCDRADAALRPCAHAGCGEGGSFRAPKSPTHIRDYHWFCLEHVREYNAKWDYCKGMTPKQIEDVIRFDTIWNRETKPLGGWRMHEERLRQTAQNFADGGETKPEAPKPPGVSSEVANALALFNLTLPLELAVLQKRYRLLAKQHHPDTQSGNKDAEAKMKDITAAFALLKAYLKAQ